MPRIAPRRVAAVALAVSLALGACSRDETPASSATPGTPSPKQAAPQAALPVAAQNASLRFTDDMNREVTLAATPSRVATLIPFAADMLIELGVTPVLVPAIRGDSPAAWKDIPTVAVEHSSGPNLEQIVAANPDLIILTSVYAQFLPQIEASTKAPVIVLDVVSLDDVQRHIATLGRITDRAEAADAMIASIDAAAPAQPTTDAPPTSVLAIFGTPHAFYTFLPESYLGDLVKRANARLVTDGLVSHKIFRGLAPLSMESVIEKNPDVILVVFHGPREMATAMLARDPAWGKLDAVTMGRVHILVDDLFVMHPGSRAPEAIKMIADALEPREQ